uniref:dUTPase-like domain-containing protein n=1 Tax=Terrapene triunguis TaxID=2587831 RepID=A0A674HZF8_9SAUR
MARGSFRASPSRWRARPRQLIPLLVSVSVGRFAGSPLRASPLSPSRLLGKVPPNRSTSLLTASKRQSKARAFSARVSGPGGRGVQKQTPSRPKAPHTVSQMQKGVSLGGAVSLSRGPRPKAAPLSVHDVPAATRGSAGIDLVNQKNMDITLPEEVLLMPSQIQGPLPEGTVGLVLPRSSASKQGLFVVPGVVDSDYGGIIHFSEKFATYTLCLSWYISSKKCS